MGLFRPDVLYCKNCGGHLEGDEEICPHCSFHPRNEGLRYAGVFLLLMVVLYTIVVLIGGTWPHVAAAGMIGVYGFFLLAVIAFLIAFYATPYRLGNLFT